MSSYQLSERSFDLQTQVQDPLFQSIGNTGTAGLPMMIGGARYAKPGLRIEFWLLMMAMAEMVLSLE